MLILVWKSLGGGFVGVAGGEGRRRARGLPAECPGNVATEAARSPAIVTRESADVLIVQRRHNDSGITWQFPAGIVKPGVPPETVAVRETFAETGIH